MSMGTAERTPTKNCTLDYTVNETVRQINSGSDIKYFNRRYGYSVNDNIIEPLDHVRQQSIGHYWSCGAKSMKRQKCTANRSKRPRNQHSHVSNRSRFCKGNFDFTSLHHTQQPPKKIARKKNRQFNVLTYPTFFTRHLRYYTTTRLTLYTTPRRITWIMNPEEI